MVSAAQPNAGPVHHDADSPPTPSLPTTTPLSGQDATLLLALLDTPGNVAHAAASGGITAERFLALIANPAARQAIEDIRAFAAARREIRADADREEFTAVLREVARASPDLVEKRRAATAGLRALDRATGYAAYPSSSPYRSSRRVAGANDPGLTHASGRSSSASPTHRRRRSIADFNLGPEDAERFLEKERRENDRLAKLIQQTIDLAGGLRAATSPTRERGSHPMRNLAPMSSSTSNPAHPPPHAPPATQHAAPSTQHGPRNLPHNSVLSLAGHESPWRPQPSDLLPVLSRPPTSALSPAALVAAAGRAISIDDAIRHRASTQDAARRTTHDLSYQPPEISARTPRRGTPWLPGVTNPRQRVRNPWNPVPGVLPPQRGKRARCAEPFNEQRADQPGCASTAHTAPARAPPTRAAA